MTRRRLFQALLGVGVVGAAARFVGAADTGEKAPTNTFAVAMTEADWQKRLTPAQFTVLRKHGTERAGSSPLDEEYRPGIYNCAGCELALFSSDTKFDSGTGWPSFWAPLTNAVGTTTDRSFFDGPHRGALHGGAAATSATCSTTGPSRPACATA